MKKHIIIISSTILITSILVGYPKVNAETIESIKNHKQKITEQRSLIKKGIENADKEIAESRNMQTQLKEQLNRIEKALQDNQKKYDQTKYQINKASEEKENLTNELLLLETKIVERNKILKERARNYQQSGASTWFWDMILDASGIGDFVSRLTAVATIAEADQTIIKEQVHDQEQVMLNRVLVEKALKDLNSAKIELEEILKVVKDQQVQKQDVLAHLKYKEEQLNQNKKDLINQDNNLANEETKLQQSITSAQSGSPYFTAGGSISVSGIPKEYMTYYLDAEKKYNIPWHILCAIHDIETNFSTISPMVSSKGALGHMQFMPKTWEDFGIDADQDGKADPFSLADAIASAANYLSVHGFNKDPRKAIWHYNHADWYINEVMQTSEKYKASYLASTTNLESVVTVGNKLIGNSVYVFGGGRNEKDINNGRFDCSSFVHWAFSQVGIFLGPLTSTTTDTLKNQGVRITFNEIQSGDLVFFDTYKKDGHVGIYVGDGKFIGAQSTTGIAIVSMETGYWKEKFNGRVIRIK